MKKAAIIGSGIGGISAAIYLITKGIEVDIFEKNSVPGGKIGEVKAGDFRFDTGPSLLTMPYVINDLFIAANEKIEAHIKLIKLKTICRYFYDKETVIDSKEDIKEMQESLALLSQEDAKRYPEFLDYSKKIYDLSSDVFLFEPFQELSNIFRLRNLKLLFKLRNLDSSRTMADAVNSYFDDYRIQKLFNRYATYNGSDPYKAPATLNIIPHVEYSMGSYYIKGGIYRLVEALAGIIIKNGGKIYLNKEVEKIIVRGGKAVGIKVDGEDLYYDYVISNSDVAFTYNKLIDGYLKKKKKINNLEPSLSGIIFLWGINKKLPELEHHNIFFSSDYEKEFNCIFNKKQIPEDPTIYISATSKEDPAHAPEGENLFVLLNMPHLNNEIDWKTDKHKVKEQVLNKLKKFNIDVSDSIVFEKIITPKDLEIMFHSNRGSIYGVSSNNKYTAFLRQRNRKQGY